MKKLKFLLLFLLTLAFIPNAIDAKNTHRIGTVVSGSSVDLTAIDSNLIPDTDSTYTIGNATYGWESLFFDNGATDGGAIYFDGVTTSYLKSNAAGTDLTLGGFTSLLPASTNTLSLGSASVALAAAYSRLLQSDSGQALALKEGTVDNYNGMFLNLINSQAVFRRGNIGAGTITMDFATGSAQLRSTDSLNNVYTYSIRKAKVTKTYSNFSTAGLTNSINIFQLPSKAAILDVYVNCTAAFTGGLISAYTISVGANATPIEYITAQDVFTAPVALIDDSVKGTRLTDEGTTNIHSFSASTWIQGHATSVGANLDAATAGSCDFYFEYSDSLE